MRKGNDNVTDGNYDWLLFILAIIVLIALWYGSWMYIDTHIQSTNTTIATHEMARGVFGDKFGAINSLFSSLAFVGIIFAIILQRRDLRQQRATIKDQSDLMSMQSFESGFFNLLEHHKNNIDQLELGAHTKRNAFYYFIELLLQNSEQFPVFNVLKKIDRNEIITIRDAGQITPQVESILEKSEIETLKDAIENRREVIGKYLDADQSLHWKHLQDAYLGAHKRSGDALSHYFRTLYIIFKYINDAQILSAEKKKDYARIVRAQLSDNELLAIFYNSLTKPDNVRYQIEFGHPKLTNFIHKYDILQNLNQNRAFHPIHWDLLESCRVREAV